MLSVFEPICDNESVEKIENDLNITDSVDEDGDVLVVHYPKI